MTATQNAPANELRDFVDLALARRLEMAETLSPMQVEALRRYWPNASSELIAGGTAAFAGSTYPANHIVGLGLYGSVSTADLDRVEEFYRSRGVPCEIVVCPLADRSLLELLGDRGYHITEFNSVLIRRLEDCIAVEAAEGIRVERVTPDTEDIWNKVVTTGFAEFGPLPENLMTPFATLPGSLNFLAKVDSVPAGGGMGQVMPEARIGAFFGTATLPEFRGRGVQTALINRRLWGAARAGCEYAVVSTMPGSGSQRNMERRGFRVAYTKVVLVRSWPGMEKKGGSDES